MNYSVKALLMILFSASLCGFAQTRETIPVWGPITEKPKDSPEVPTLTIFFPAPEKAVGTAVIVCPGGGYGRLAINHEGYDVAKWFNTLGVTAAVLKYRLPKKGFRHPCPLEDLQRSIRLMRANSKKWHIDPSRIGIFGSSAGGHLVSTAATHMKPADMKSKDVYDHYSTRPDFLIMLYPVINNHRGSFYNLLGKNPNPKLLEDLKNDKKVTSQTPPTFIVHATDDHGVPADNSIDFYQALRKAKIPAELHLYATGGHGFGMRRKMWLKPLTDWLAQRGLLKRSAK